MEKSKVEALLQKSLDAAKVVTVVSAAVVGFTPAMAACAGQETHKCGGKCGGKKGKCGGKCHGKCGGKCRGKCGGKKGKCGGKCHGKCRGKCGGKK